MIRYLLVQDTRDQGTWTSSEVFEGTAHDAVRAVRAGFLAGEPRRAVRESDGSVIYALDAKGNEVKS